MLNSLFFSDFGLFFSHSCFQNFQIIFRTLPCLFFFISTWNVVWSMACFICILVIYTSTSFLVSCDSWYFLSWTPCIFFKILWAVNFCASFCCPLIFFINNSHWFEMKPPWTHSNFHLYIKWKDSYNHWNNNLLY